MFDFLKPYECPVCRKRYWFGHDAFICCKGTPAWEIRRERMRRRSIADGIDPDTGKKIKNPPKPDYSTMHSHTFRTCTWCNGTGKKNGLPCDWCGGSGKLPNG